MIIISSPRKVMPTQSTTSSSPFGCSGVSKLYFTEMSQRSWSAVIHNYHFRIRHLTNVRRFEYDNLHKKPISNTLFCKSLTRAQTDTFFNHTSSSNHADNWYGNLYFDDILHTITHPNLETKHAIHIANLWFQFFRPLAQRYNHLWTWCFWAKTAPRNHTY